MHFSLNISSVIQKQGKIKNKQHLKKELREINKNDIGKNFYASNSWIWCCVWRW
jgi:hypothetical protein